MMVDRRVLCTQCNSFRAEEIIDNACDPTGEFVHHCVFSQDSTYDQKSGKMVKYSDYFGTELLHESKWGWVLCREKNKNSGCRDFEERSR